MLALHTGARPGELSALTWSNVNVKGASVRIDASKTKTTRTLRLASHVADTLRAHRKRQATERMAMGPRWEPSDLVFVSEAGTRLDASNLRRLVTRLARDAGLDWTPTPYTFRHTRVDAVGVGSARRGVGFPDGPR